VLYIGEEILLPLTASVKNVGPASVISIAGKIALGDTWHSVDEILQSIRDQGTLHVVVNLSGVPFIDSAGLGLLVMNLSKMKAAGGTIKLAEPQSRVQSIIELTRLTGLFPIYATEEDALNSFGVGSTAAPVQ
jgi:anti-sigma B factor antagonist